MWVCRTGMGMTRSSWWEATSTTAMAPANSQLNTAVRPSAEKSPWSMPAHAGAGVMSCWTQLCGSYQTSSRLASATAIAYWPSGVKYMLYGSTTGICRPGSPVFGSKDSR